MRSAKPVNHLKYYNFPPRFVVTLSCVCVCVFLTILFFGRFQFVCIAFARCCDKWFLVVTKIRLTNKNDFIAQIAYFTVLWKENIHGNKNVNKKKIKNMKYIQLFEIPILCFFMFCSVRIQWWLCKNPQRVYLFSQQFWKAGTVCE